MKYYSASGVVYQTDESNYKGGGEGNVYDIVGQPSLVAKIYKPEMLSPALEEKITAISRQSVNWNGNLKLYTVPPIEPLYTDRRAFAGYVMKKLGGKYVSLCEVYDANVGKAITYKNKIITAANICVITKLAHDSNVVIGDYNQKNIGVDSSGCVHLFDNDSFQITDNGKTYRCIVGVQAEMAPEILRTLKKEKADLRTVSMPVYNKYTDYFTMAEHIFHLLMNGAHPFNSRIEASKLPDSQTISSATISTIEAARRAVFTFARPTAFRKPPEFAPAYEILSPELRACFERAFIDGLEHPEKRPTPDEFYGALRRYSDGLVRLSCGHYHYKDYKGPCEWCRLEKRQA